VEKLTQWRMGLDGGQISQSMTLESRSWSKVEMKTRPGVAQLGGVVNVPAWQSTREATVVEDGSQRRTDLSGSSVEGAARLWQGFSRCPVGFAGWWTEPILMGPMGCVVPGCAPSCPSGRPLVLDKPDRSSRVVLGPTGWRRSPGTS
jgi:hypothetical protein